MKNKANVQGIKRMKQIRTSFNTTSVIVLLALTAGCATTASTQNKESMLVASGFKVITPKTGAQQQKLQQLPPGHMAMINRQGKTYYIFPDAAHNQAYVGGPQEYRLTNNSAPQITLPTRISRPPKCIRTQPWTGVRGAGGEWVGDRWEWD